MSKSLKILTAGVAFSMVKKAAAIWEKKNPDLPCEIISGGSVDLIRKVKNGVPCDVLISADDAIIRSMLFPQYADNLKIFAGNRMVVLSLNGKPVTDTDWQDKLLASDTVFGYSDPTLDPGGYRAEMAILLADCKEAGLAEKLMKHPGRKILNSADEKSADYKIYYYTKALASGNPFAVLSPEMDLSDPALNDTYAKVEIDLGDGKVKGSAINHALTIPKTAEHKKEAEEFVEIFLAQDFASEGFLPR